MVVGDLVSLNCSAQATPPPYITWVFSDGNGTEVAVVDDVIFNISISQGAGDEVTSVLTFIADSAMAGSNTFFCVANNSITSIQSNTSIVTIQSKSVSTCSTDMYVQHGHVHACACNYACMTSYTCIYWADYVRCVAMMLCRFPDVPC